MTFKEGDEVEVVVELQSDRTLTALAVRRPSDQILWIFPHCSRGAMAQNRHALRIFFWTFVVISLISSIGYGKLPGSPMIPLIRGFSLEQFPRLYLLLLPSIFPLDF
ncbi:hypothetical protein [Variovorax rhizosphaerae]|uniref:Uncharacterized protein n=1 Tax=Variovorax rhizosphaerae TaxID=1836200 RepID=A0ABU8WFA5_9BURK